MRPETVWEVMSVRPGWELITLVESGDWGDVIDELWAYEPGATPERTEGNPCLAGYCRHCRLPLCECECEEGPGALGVEVRIFILQAGSDAIERVMHVDLDDLEFFLPSAIEIALQLEKE